MIKSNGGVFGRNPTFNDVTVDGNLTVNGDIALGDDIVVADSLTVQGTTASTSTTTGALRVVGGISTQDGLYTGSDAFINGARVGIGPAGTDNTVLGVGAGAALQAGGINNVLIGDTCGDNVTTGDDNVGIGRSALDTLDVGIGNIAIGTNAISSATNASSNVAIGRYASERMLASNSVSVGAEALRYNTLGAANVAVGRSALSAATTAIATVTTTDAGTGGTDGAKTAIQLERDSGGTMVTYPTVDLTVTGGAVSGTVTVATGGSGSTSSTAGGIIFRANAAGIAAGVPADWRCQLQTVSTASGNTAVGHQAGLSLTTASSCTFVGANAGDAVTSGASNTAIGNACLTTLTTGSLNVGIGASCLEVLGTGGFNTCVGVSAGRYHLGSSAVCIGALAGANIGIGVAATDGFIFIGPNAGRRFGSGSTNNLLRATNSILIGNDVRASADNQTNEIAIGAGLIGDGSNTTVIGNTSTTSTRFAGTATSVLRTSGDTLRIDNDRTPATAGAAGNEGDICWDANYIYVCVAANTWKRVAIATWP